MQPDGIDYLERIEALTRLAPSLDFLVQHGGGECVEYDVIGGFAVGMGLLSEHSCAIQKVFASSGTKFPEHCHDEHEYFVVIEGNGKYIVEDREYEFGPLDCIMIPPKAKHAWYYETATKMIVLTIPAAKGFPGGRT